MRYTLLLLLFFLSFSYLRAQGSRLQWGIGTSVHLSNSELQIGPAAKLEMVLRTGLSGLARYRLNRKANWQWGPFRNRLNLFWESGLRLDMLAYSYDTGQAAISRDYYSMEVPLNLVLVSDVRGFPWWRRRRLHGYGRLGGTVGWAFPQMIQENVGNWRESTDIGGLRAGFHMSSGLLRKMEAGGHISVGIFARIGLTTVVRGELSTPYLEPAAPFRSASSLFGLEWSYFFGQPENSRSRLPEEPVDMILCPRF